jgi:lipoprotein-anchoring transpeptidase ErfK/SrfK
VPVLDEQGAWVRIGDGEWVAASDLRIARLRGRPVGVGEDDRWIDVDVTQQVLINYLGDTPVFATLVSTGRRHGTPTGIYRIASKHGLRTMKSDSPKGHWNLPHVPFVLYFRHHYALHGAYWHDRFGNARSMGCVNLTPDDARIVYAWAGPEVPPGWLDYEIPEGTGTVVRIHDGSDDDPPWRDWQGRERKASRARRRS